MGIYRGPIRKSMTYYFRFSSASAGFLATTFSGFRRDCRSYVSDLHPQRRGLDPSKPGTVDHRRSGVQDTRGVDILPGLNLVAACLSEFIQFIAHLGSLFRQVPYREETSTRFGDAVARNVSVQVDSDRRPVKGSPGPGVGPPLSTSTYLPEGRCTQTGWWRAWCRLLRRRHTR